MAKAMAITLRMYAGHKGWLVEAIHADIHFVRDGDEEQRKRMAEIAERTPVTLTLKRGLEIRATLA